MGEQNVSSSFQMFGFLLPAVQLTLITNNKGEIEE